MPSVDLTTLPGWAALAAKTYNITVVAKADGYRDSEPSAAVSVEKAADTPILKAGTYKWVDIPTIPNTLVVQPLNFISDNWDSIYVMAAPADSTIRYGHIDEEGEETFSYAYINQKWSSTAAQTITLATDQHVSADFYDWAITGGNLVKQS